MKNATLVIMAAGIGSRFGGGIKQLEPVGPNGEIIMDYSIYDAMEAGFNKIVFVIRKDIEEDFKKVIGNRISKKIHCEYAYQELEDIPETYRESFKKRVKPWGTGQAILCCKEIVKEPFLVINADDYYGKEAYREAFRELTSEKPKGDRIQISMVSFILKNTLSENGGVTRGICKVNKDGMLTDIVETKNIVKTPSGTGILTTTGVELVASDSPVSMNMWGLSPEIFGVLEEGFEKFLANLKVEDMISEYLLPTIIGGFLKEDKIEVTVLESKDEWFGVTYKEDKDDVVAAIKELITKGEYR